MKLWPRAKVVELMFLKSQSSLPNELTRRRSGDEDYNDNAEQDEELKPQK